MSQQIVVHKLILRFDAGELVGGNPEYQAEEAVCEINRILEAQASEWKPQLYLYTDECEVGVEDDPDEG